MQKFISQKQLYSNVKSISDEVQEGTTFIVLKYSKPAYKIVPLDGDHAESIKNKKKKQTKSKTLFEEFGDLQFSSGDKNLSKNIDQILYK